MLEHDARRKAGTALPWLGVALMLAVASSGIASERGYPLITIFAPETHRAGPQTFDLVQDSRGVFYFGNLHGLLTYDGAWWRLRSLPDEQVALALATNPAGEIALGLVNDFGVLDSDQDGGHEYRSLLPLLPEDARDFRDVRGICWTPAGFLYVTETDLLLWNGSELRVAAKFAPGAAPRGCHADEGGTFLRTQKGLLHFDVAKMTTEPAGIEGHILLLLRDGAGRLIVAVRDRGLFLLEDGVATPWAAEASHWLQGKLVTSGARLADGRFVVATRQNGILILEPSGEVEQVIGPETGLPDAILNEVKVDREGALWLAMEGPIVRIDLGSPVTVFDIRSGLRGTASDVVRFRGQLYAGSSHGLHLIDESGYARRLPGIEESVWRLEVIDDELLIGTEKGIYRLGDENHVTKIVELESEVYTLYRSPTDPALVWIARGDGISSIRRAPDGWRDGGLLPGTPRNVSSLVERDGALWAGSVFSGILRIDGAYDAKLQIRQFGSGEMNVFEAGGRLVFVKATGEILQIEDGRLIPDQVLGHVGAPRGFFVLMEDARGNIWINSTPPRVFTRLADGTYAREGRPLVSVTATDIQTMRAGSDGVLWFASDKGLFRYERSDGEILQAQPPPLIRRVLAGESRILFSGSIPNTPTELPHDFGRIRIEFAPASYRPGVSYQYRLEPIDDDWSEWIDEPFIDYTTLSANDYTFRLRSRGPAMIPSAETQWLLVVHPPWYLTKWAWALWALLVAGFIVAIIRVRTGALRKQATRLQARVAEQTAELQEAVTQLETANARLEVLTLSDDLTGIANRRYFERTLAEEWNRARRHRQPLALILLDLDHFKDLNDRFGHPAGDECLRRIGNFLAGSIRRSGELVARYGGEEFAILIPAASAEAAIAVAESARAGIEGLVIDLGDGIQCAMTTSCGVSSMIPGPDETSEILVSTADRALYSAKHSGRNCVRVADDSATQTWLHDASL